MGVRLLQRLAVSMTALALAGCGGSQSLRPPIVPNAALQTGAIRTQSHLTHATIGFNVDTPARVATAAHQGIEQAVLYGGAPPVASPLANALRQYKMDIVDGSVSVQLDHWECHRTHTVATPPPSSASNAFCQYDTPEYTDAVVLHNVKAIAQSDAARPDVTAYWVLDDWPSWDPGSAHELLQKIHALLAAATPQRPAICGFGAGLGLPARNQWSPGTAANYSNESCDIVGWYIYADTGTHPSNGDGLDWNMKPLLPLMAHTLARYGWNIDRTPLYGIGQAWSGSFAKPDYQPGLSAAQMHAQAQAFCDFGASIVGWYGWDDSGFNAQTRTPNNSPQIAGGIAGGIRACRHLWRTR
jgi:hypothetical protein